MLSANGLQPMVTVEWKKSMEGWGWKCGVGEVCKTSRWKHTTCIRYVNHSTTNYKRPDKSWPLLPKFPPLSPRSILSQMYIYIPFPLYISFHYSDLVDPHGPHIPFSFKGCLEDLFTHLLSGCHPTQ